MTEECAQLLASIEQAGGLISPNRTGASRGTIASAIAAGLVAPAGKYLHLTETGRVALTTVTSPAEIATDGPPDDAPLVAWATDAPPRTVQRIAVIDTENIPKSSPRPPLFIERALYQIGGWRCGTDTGWVTTAESFGRYVELEDPADVSYLRNDRPDDHRVRYDDEAIDAETALNDLLDWLSGADIVVAHNGSQIDFPAIQQLLKRVWKTTHPEDDVPDAFPTSRLVDSLVVAHLVWPNDRTHDLQSLRERHTDISHDDTVAHDAIEDCRVLAAILGSAATDTTTWPTAVSNLVSRLGANSPALLLLAGMGGLAPEDRRLSRTAVRSHLTQIVTGNAALRDPVNQVIDSPVIDDSVTIDDLRGADGRVDVARLASHLHPDPESRPQQEATTATLHRYADTGGGLVEAPTGTGKTFALLAAGLDWLNANPANKVIVATFTKALQRQLGGDLARLGPLLADSTLVKGQANRLSLRGLTVAVTDVVVGHGPRPDNRYAELLIYLVTRLADPPPDRIKEWEARSVDAADLPVALASHCGGSFHRWCRRLSQALASDYENGTDALSAAAQTVRAALDSSRFVIANHALLLAHRENLGHANHTLLLIDEAHLLEGAATDALAFEVDLSEVTDVVNETVDHLTKLRARISNPAGADPGARDENGDPVTSVGKAERAYQQSQATRRLLREGRVGKPAAAMFDRLVPPDPLGGTALKTLTVSSPDDPTIRGRQRTNVIRAIRLLGRDIRLLHAAMQSCPSGDEASTIDRHLTLTARLYSLSDALRRIGYDGAIHLDLPLRTPTSSAGGDGSARIGPDPNGPGGDHSSADDSEFGDGDDFDRRRIAANRVVWATQTREPDRHRLDQYGEYSFTITTSPIELAGEPEYLAIAAHFSAVCYVSATLTVPDPSAGDQPDPPADPEAIATPASSWRFIRDRLALPDSLPAVAYPSPFDYADQARLMAFSDFPSWAEEADLAAATVAHQTQHFRAVIEADQNVDDTDGVLVLTTSRSAAAQIAHQAGRRRAETGATSKIHHAQIIGNRAITERMRAEGGTGIGTRGLWQGTDIDQPNRIAIVWINKLPFAPFADPLIAHRRARVAAHAEAAGHLDPDEVALRRYYLPLAALELRQAVGRLIRSTSHRGAIIISDRKLAGGDRIRRAYRDVFLGSLDAGLLRADTDDCDDVTGANIATMADGWEQLWSFFASRDIISAATAAAESTPDALARHTLLPTTRKIRHAAFNQVDVATLTSAAAAAIDIVDDAINETVLTAAGDADNVASGGQLCDALCDRAEQVIGWLRDSEAPVTLRPHQRAVIRAVAAGRDVLAVLPTGYGKSFTFQLPALLLPGVTLVISPLVSLMTDQAMDLNHTIGGTVRALVGPMRESSSRRGKAEALSQLAGDGDHGIKLIYTSPERLGHAQFAAAIRRGVANGTIRSIVIDEAHTFVTWGEDFRPSFRRVERLLDKLKHIRPGLQITAVTATATATVRRQLIERAFGGGKPTEVTANPIRPELAIYRRTLTGRNKRTEHSTLVGKIADTFLASASGHAIFYCLTVADVERLAGMLRSRHGGERILVYHGRMAAADKAAVQNRFKDAPTVGEDGFAPLIVVATAAFGLGINRADIRAVVCATPPVDLAALYQQLGRAGRDHQPAAGITILTHRALRTAQWMSRLGDTGPLEDAARHIAVTDGPIDLDDIARQLRIARTANNDPTARDIESQRAALVRVIADLADSNLLADHGDTPARVTLRRGHVRCPHDGLTDLYHDWLDSAIDGEVALTDAAAIAVAPAAKVIDDLDVLRNDAATGRIGHAWTAMSVGHSHGWLDVSQFTRAEHRWLTDYQHLAKIDVDEVVGMVIDRASRRADDLAAELAEMKAFHTSIGCAQQDLAVYFHAKVGEVCTGRSIRCSTCTARSGDIHPPALLDAVNSTRLIPPTANPAGALAAQLADDLARLLRRSQSGALWLPEVRAALRGDQTYFHSKSKGNQRVAGWLHRSSAFGSWIGLRQAPFDDAIEALVARRDADHDGPFLRRPSFAATPTTHAQSPTTSPAT